MTLLLKSRIGRGLRRAAREAEWLKQRLFVRGNPRKVNIGSGDRDWSGWLLLDEVRFPKTRKFRSTPDCAVPLSDVSADLVYSSHHLEHLDDNSVNRILAETHRVLGRSGYFVVKIPNFSLFKENYIAGNHELLEFCGVHDVVYTWKEFGMQDSFAAQTAMMFCGYWNTHYGNHFSGQVSRVKGAYHGPPMLQESKLDLALRTLSIRELSRYFNREALSDPKFKQFNHQNAWDTSGFVQLVEEMGFECLTTSLEEIEDTALDIPDLLMMREISAFYMFKKRELSI